MGDTGKFRKYDKRGYDCNIYTISYTLYHNCGFYTLNKDLDLPKRYPTRYKGIQTLSFRADRLVHLYFFNRAVNSSPMTTYMYIGLYSFNTQSKRLKSKK